MRRTLFVLTALSAFIIFSASTSLDSTKEISKCPYLERIHKVTIKTKCPYLLDKGESENKVNDKNLNCPFLENRKNELEKPVKAKKIKIT